MSLAVSLSLLVLWAPRELRRLAAAAPRELRRRHASCAPSYSKTRAAQVLLHLPAAFMDFPHVREVVALNTEIKDVEKAFTYWVSLNPGDAGIWFAYTIRTQVQSAIFDYRTKQVTGGDDKENKNAAAGLSIS